MRSLRILALVFPLLAPACGGDDEAADGSFGAACSQDADCDSKLCFAFGSKGSRCTRTCPADPAQCPNDGAGCNDKGVCKVP